jgi:hypothetical protein
MGNPEKNRFQACRLMPRTSVPGASGLKLAKVVLEILTYIVAGLFFAGIFFRQILFSHFDLLYGSAVDSRFNGVILEHWWQVLHGTGQWLSPPFFFPATGVLGYSDAGFLNALPYVLLRCIGLDPFTSYQIVLFALVAMGWIGTILFLRCCLKLSMVPTLVATALCVFPNSMAASSAQTQLFTIYCLPYLAIATYVLLHNFAKVTPVGIAAGIAVAAMVPAIAYTSYYVGWFSIFFLLLLSGVCYFWTSFHSAGNADCRRIFWQRHNWHIIFPYCALSAICFIPFLLTYLPVVVELGVRPYDEISAMLPSFIDYVNVGTNNWLWGKILHSTLARLGSRPMPMARELTRGLPCCLLLTFLISSVYSIRKVRHYQVTVTEAGTCKIVVGRNEANHDDKLTMLAAGLGTTILLAWLLMLKIGDDSLWWFVTKLVPGASGIRAVYRFQNILAFPLAVVVAIGLHQSIKYARRHIQSRLKRSGCAVVLGLFCLILLGEQFNIGGLANYSKEEQRSMLAGMHHPPGQAKVFIVLPPTGLKLEGPWEVQIDAMIIAQKYGLHTINGFSGHAPLEWDGIDDYGKPKYCRALLRWIRYYNLENDELYYLDETTGCWSPAWEYRPIQR